jgi:hypothetical protein
MKNWTKFIIIQGSRIGTGYLMGTVGGAVIVKLANPGMKTSQLLALSGGCILLTYMVYDEADKYVVKQLEKFLDFDTQAFIGE